MSDTTKAAPSKMAMQLAKKTGEWLDARESLSCQFDDSLAPIYEALKIGLVHARASHFVNLNSYADDVRVIEDAITLLSPPAEKGL